MAVIMTFRWDDAGTLIPVGQAKYAVNEQPVAEYDNWAMYTLAADMQDVIDDVINKFNANSILKADTDNTPAALAIAEQTIVGRKTGSSIAALTAAEVRTILNVESGADVTDTTNVNAAGAVMESDFDAHTILRANIDNLPGTLSVGTNTFVGRLAGNIEAMHGASARSVLNVEDGADVTADNPPQAHNQSATTITSGILAVAQGGTGVSGDSYDADKVDGCDAGDDVGKVWKIPTPPGCTAMGVNPSGQVFMLAVGNSGYQLTSNGLSNPPTWAAASDLIFSDTHCPKCGQEFKDGDDLFLHVIGHNEVGDILTLPMHISCANEPKKTAVLKRKVMEDTHILDEYTGELKIQRAAKTQDKVVTKHMLKDGYIIDNKSGKVHKLDKDGNVGKKDLLLSDVLETTEETISEIIYEDVEFEL